MRPDDGPGDLLLSVFMALAVLAVLYLTYHWLRG